MVMSVAEIRSKVLAVHEGNPQRRGLAEVHLDELERAIAGLAAIGHNVGMEFGASPPAVQFPKMLYHAKEVQPQIVGSSEEEEAARKAGWNEYPGGVPPATDVKMPGVANPPKPEVPPPTTKVSAQVAAPAANKSSTKGG